MYFPLVLEILLKNPTKKRLGVHIVNTRMGLGGEEEDPSGLFGTTREREGVPEESVLTIFHTIRIAILD